jgi:hypothetical protein
VAHHLEATLKVTFDSNSWQPVVRPDKFPKNPRQPEFIKVNAALKDGRVIGFICDTAATLEGIPRADRGKYFARPGGHPGLAAILRDRLEDAQKLGIRLVHAPRIGLAVPEGIDDLYFVEANVDDMAQRHARSSDAIRGIEGRGIGKDQIEKIGKNIASRLGLSGPWNKFLDRAADSKENELIADAIGEWADEDAIAAHIAYGHDFFCTDDFGKSASKTLGVSIFTPANRVWLTSRFSVQFLKLDELAAKL